MFTMLAAGLFARPVQRTVCGMRTGAGLARIWHHGRAHRFFSHARWNPHRFGSLLAELIVTRLLPPGTPITVAVDDTLFRRRGKKVRAGGWFHDGSAADQVTLGFGNNWVVLAIIVSLPFLYATGGVAGPGRVGGQRRARDTRSGPRPARPSRRSRDLPRR
jgi:hypothetical protein